MKFFKDQGLEDLPTNLRVGLYFFSRMHHPLTSISWLFKILLLYVLSRLLYPIVKRRGREKPVVSFDSYYYTGNAKAVYETMRELHPEYEYYWIARNIKTFRDLRNQGERVFLAYSPLGVIWYLKTDVWVRVQTGIGVFSFLPHRNYKVIHLKHGVGPKGSMPSRKDFDMHDAWCVPSDFIKKRHIELWGAPAEKLYVTGFPRMDYLLRYLSTPREKLLMEIGVKGDGRIILFAPTFDIGLWPWGDPYSGFEELCRFCREKKVILILRLHPFTRINRRRLKKIINKYKESVYWLDMSVEPDTMKLLAIADILITDWSSIYTDYFLTRRPIIYLEVNLEYFTRERGKPEVPIEYRAGEIVRDENSFFKTLELVLTKGNRFREKQEELLSIIHGDVDGNSSKRVIELIDHLLTDVFSNRR